MHRLNTRVPVNGAKTELSYAVTTGYKNGVQNEHDVQKRPHSMQVAESLRNVLRNAEDRATQGSDTHAWRPSFSKPT